MAFSRLLGVPSTARILAPALMLKEIFYGCLCEVRCGSAI